MRHHIVINALLKIYEEVTIYSASSEMLFAVFSTFLYFYIHLWYPITTNTRDIRKSSMDTACALYYFPEYYYHVWESAHKVYDDIHQLMALKYC